MDIKALSELLKKSSALTEDEDISLLSLLDESASQSRKIILERVPEKEFVGMCRMVKLVLMSIMLANGEGQALVLAEKMGELDSLLDTYVLSVVGLLMREEVV